MSQPRAQSADGSACTDIFGFRLKEPALAGKLRVGQRVELRADEG